MLFERYVPDANGDGREAHVERTCNPVPIQAEVWERAADSVLTRAGPRRGREGRGNGGAPSL